MIRMKKTAICKGCGYVANTEDMYRIYSPSTNYFYICGYCHDHEASYYDENDHMTHKQAKHGLTWSIELETSERNTASNWLYQHKFLPTSDGSIMGTEWKSPIYRNLSGLQKLFRTIESKCKFDSDCGTHLNIGTYNEEKMDMLKRFYHSLFLPLCDHLEANPEKTEQIFGLYLHIMQALLQTAPHPHVTKTS